MTERELAAMQSDLASMLHQQQPAGGARARRLARSITICATCSPPRSSCPTSCRRVRDPRVQRFAPKLMRALERAIEFCQSTLSYGRAQEPPPDRRMVALEAAGRRSARELSA